VKILSPRYFFMIVADHRTPVPQLTYTLCDDGRIELKGIDSGKFVIHKMSADETLKNSWNVCTIATNLRSSAVEELTATVLSLGVKKGATSEDFGPGGLAYFYNAIAQEQRRYFGLCTEREQLRVRMSRGIVPSQMSTSTITLTQQSVSPASVFRSPRRRSATSSTPQLPEFGPSTPLGEELAELVSERPIRELDAAWSSPGPYELSPEHNEHRWAGY
jgi:hypothetical protein